MDTIGERIKNIREQLGWTQERLAKEASLSKGFLSDVENGKRDISSTNVLKIANAMGASLEYLMRGKVASQGEKKGPIQIPPELSRAAEEMDWTHSEALTLLDTHKSIIARRSSMTVKPPTVEEWKELYELIKRVYPTNDPNAKE